ncbi:MAG: ATP-binding protein, partial [Gaiella sp.]|nr:ATP-binding protein [Gaiella sp.]
MLFRGKAIQEIDKNDLLGLIGTSEQQQEVDFKKFAYPPPPDSELPSNQSERDKVRNRWKIDLCTDLTALANAHGGWIICGMKEMNGTATELCGIGPSVNAEREIARLEQCAVSGVEPPLPRIKFQSVDLADPEKAQAILIHVPRSFRAPHRVRETGKFHIRRSGRNDEMNIEELRAAFNLSANLVDRVKNFRKERTDTIADHKQEEIPVQLEYGPGIVLHIVPILFSEPASAFDLSVFQSRSPAMWVHEKYLSNGRFNLEGYVKPHGDHGYTQVFRNGAVECAEIKRGWGSKQERSIGLYVLEDLTLCYLDPALYAQKNLGVQLPSAVLLSLIGVRGYALVTGANHPFERSDHPPITLNRDTILLPDVLIEDYACDHKAV